MTITNKPNAGDPIVVPVNDNFGGTKYIADPVFWRYLDELDSQSNETANTAFDFSGQISILNARMAEVEEELADNPFTVDSTTWTVDTTYITADWTKA